MTTDRELLELAAKAVGYDTSHRWNAERLKLVPPAISLCIPGVSSAWNPLEDDGDALRLAVELDMIIVVNRVDERSEASAGYSNEDLVQVTVKHDSDRHAATRRAITRAAAEIGRHMEDQQP